MYKVQFPVGGDTTYPQAHLAPFSTTIIFIHLFITFSQKNLLMILKLNFHETTNRGHPFLCCPTVSSDLKLH